MRIANLDGRLVLLDPDRPGSLAGLDVAETSGGRFDPEPQAIYERWAEFRTWVPSASFSEAVAVDRSALGPVAPRPPQVFAVGLNYRDHAVESGMALPDEPLVFTKYASSFTGPTGDITLSPGNVDWEVELVAVLAEGGRRIPEARGWDHVAGLCIGQDVSDRVIQFAAPPAQFGMGKSCPGYAPIGPALVSVDEFENPDDLELGCSVNGEQMQKSRTSQMVFSVPTLIAKLSAIVDLLPGDVIFTGTPAGVGVGQDPPRFLKHGDELRTWCEGVGELSHRFVSVEDATSS